MNPTLARLLFLAAAFAAYPAAPTAAQNLSTRSPFMPEGGPAAGAPTDNAPLELRGIVATKDGYLFGIYDPAKKQSTWARLNEPGSSFTLRSHDVANETVTVDYQGRSMTLALKTAKVESSGPVPNPAFANLPRPVNQPPAVLNPSAADEARRLEGVAAEVRRRRMLRQAASQQSGAPGVQPPAGMPPPGAVPIVPGARPGTQPQVGVPQPK